MVKDNKVIFLLVIVMTFIPISQNSHSQTTEKETIQNTLETLEKFTRLSGTIEYGNNNSELSTNNTSNIDNTEIVEDNQEIKPISDELLKCADQTYALSFPQMSKEDKVKVLNQLYVDPESTLREMCLLQR